MPPKRQPKSFALSKPGSISTPKPLPKAILHRPSATPPLPTAQAAHTLPARIRLSASANILSVASASKGSA